jgi:hypothetical protein
MSPLDLSLSETKSGWYVRPNRAKLLSHERSLQPGLVGALVLLFRSRVSLEAEILILRHQLNIHRRHVPKRVAFGAMDRLIFVGLYRLVPNTIKALTIVKPAAIIRWRRAGFRSYWRWQSRDRCGRPTVPLEIRRLIREMSIANPLWGAPRIHGELLKIGIDIGQTSVAKYMAKRRDPPSEGWRTFLRKSCRRHRRDGSVRRTDNLISSALRLIDCGAGSMADFMVWRHSASDRGMDRKSDHGSLRLGISSPLSHS